MTVIGHTAVSVDAGIDVAEVAEVGRPAVRVRHHQSFDSHFAVVSKTIMVATEVAFVMMAVAYSEVGIAEARSVTDVHTGAIMAAVTGSVYHKISPKVGLWDD